MKVLIVDDCPVSLEIASVLLSGSGLDVVTSHSINKVLDVAPDLIVLDLYMPDKSGVDVCRQLKSDSETSDIPVIMLSSSYDIIDKSACFNAGAIDYLEKPIGREALINAINAYASIGVMVKASKRIHRGNTSDTEQEEHRRDTIPDS